MTNQKGYEHVLNLSFFRPPIVYRLPPVLLSDYVQGLVSRKLEPDHRLTSETHRNWDEITSGQLNFDRRRQEIKVLQHVDGSHLLQFFDR